MKMVYAAIALLALLGVVWMLVNVSSGFHVSTTPKTTQVATDEASTAHDGEHFKGTMQDLLTRGGSYQCTVTVVTQGITTRGAVYTSKSKMRGDFTANIPPVGNVETHIIMQNSTAYTWTNMASQGYKFPIQNGAVRGSGANADAAAALNQNYDFNCTAWSADDSKFDLPSGIAF